MAITSGTPILLSDLVYLATNANGTAHMTFDVVPMYYNGTSKYGHNAFSNVKVYATGVNYMVGDLLGIQMTTADGHTINAIHGYVRVVAVNSTGGVVGIRLEDSAALQGVYGSVAASPQSTIGGSGTGCQFTLDYSQVGPTSAYSFYDWSTDYGSITGVYIVNGGTGYSSSDLLTDPVSGMTATVLTVDGSGVILTVTLSSSPTIVPQGVDEMTVTGGSGSGAILGGYYSLTPNPSWLTELNRMRSNEYNLGITANGNISGPWPVSGYVSTFSAYFASEVDFYYADTGSPESVSLTIDFPVESLDISTFYGGPGPYTTLNCVLVVGGTVPVTFSGRLYFSTYAPDGTGSASCTTDFPGASFTWDGYGLTADITSVTVNPGTYHFSATNSKFFANAFLLGSAVGGDTGNCTVAATVNSTPVEVPGIHNSKRILKIDCTKSTGGFPFGLWNAQSDTAANANSRTAYAQLIGLQGYGAARVDFWESGIPTYVATTTGFFAAKTPMVLSLNPVQYIQMPWNYWRHKNDGIGGTFNENPMLLGNLDTATPSAASNGYSQLDAVEAQHEPPSWKASTFFSNGFVIIDSNGNWQKVATAGHSGVLPPPWASAVGESTSDGTVAWLVTKAPKADTWASTTIYSVGVTVIDANGNTQTAIVGGTSGMGEPTWSKIFNSTVTDGTVTWKLTGSGLLVNDAIHKTYGLPRYPFYWDSETRADLKPPTSSSESEKTIWGCGNQWQQNNSVAGTDAGWQQDNKAIGWWIYSISINRIGSNYNGNFLLPEQDATGNPSEIPVTIGCIRSGSFVAFGTYNTGQTITVLWPIFTSDALVFQASERVDVQAVAISSGGGGVSIGATTVGYPISAVHVGDANALLIYVR